MTAFRDHLQRLEQDGDALAVESDLHTVDEVAMVGYESLKHNGPAITYENTAGVVRLASGAYAGPDQLQPHEQKPWTRIALAVGLDTGTSYAELLEYTTGLRETTPVAENGTEPLDARPAGIDLGDLGLPVPPTCEGGMATLGIFAVGGDRTTWSPVRGRVRGPNRLRVSIPERLGEELGTRARVTVSLGVPCDALLSAYLPWFTGARQREAFPVARGPDSLSVSRHRGMLIPTSSEVVVDGRVVGDAGALEEPLAGWERLLDTTTVDIAINEIRTRNSPTVPFASLGAPLSDDIQLAGLLEAAKLHRRINSYWGVSPIEWLLIPPEARLNFCIVASEILYAGFEWQLANALFTFSDSFDKVLILDTDVPSTDLGKALQDMWVKAHPSHNWIFSTSDAPRATAPLYRQDGSTGSRLYVDATWDARWDQEYIAPRVGFEESFPEEIQAAVRESWTSMGFSDE
ncbi:probable prenyl carboxy-lyase [Natronomonas pharaonis DSM 2160]|uniref:Probable prenyl carboxy-lyase n=1 Tax=Natronomonas pharaonis (strain ATCC 35678 / DSM 2160 / CIP 103997 / JCM 8858 / NBRC 14720 / NCIMB 2260 / Gabara) TaxID=348780 RepID=A0A1U7EXB6_NATPD|nr:UbiD family decarboxylase domain-containing protein [Natronomonas pharaonis]CAI49799.1 probable prenyl carboxy-lyase [Natronomonas pharaonis DSM 2160]